MNTLEAGKSEILASVGGLIEEIIGEEWVRETPITMETSFAQDLELESIELVALSEKIQQRYGEAVDFPAWLSGMELEQIIALKVGDLVEHIASCQSKT
ncbi:MAG: acyl carrier protein [Holophagaceae bacterium]|nr:acyl carrier protein [Holophagaceae bacterium]